MNNDDGIGLIFHLTDMFECLKIIDIELECTLHRELITYWKIDE